jgi:3-isopropylmalate/(R)-2-methylmalate dehydratase large subunit
MEKAISLTPGKRILFLTKNPELIRKQLTGELNLKMEELSVDDLLDDINTDAMTPAWVCFSHKPEDIALNAYAGLIVDGERVIPERALIDGDFEVIVSGYQKGVGSSRETAVQAEKYSGIRIAIAASFAPIHAANNINVGVLMADHGVLKRLQNGQEIPLAEFMRGRDPIKQEIIKCGGLFNFAKALKNGDIEVPGKAQSQEAQAMTMAEKIIAAHAVGGARTSVKPGEAVLVNVDGGYSHEFTSAQVHYFLANEYGRDYTLPNPAKFAVFEDHLIYADGVEKYAPFISKINTLREMQREFQEHTSVRNYNARDGRSPGICHQVAREQFIDPGDFIQATDSHTCMAGGNNSFGFGVGATEYANLIHSGFTSITVPESIRFDLIGELEEGVTAKDVILYILANHAKREQTLDRVMEFGGPGMARLSMDERATLANMATECTARSGICEWDDKSLEWLKHRRPEADLAALRERAVSADPDAHYEGGRHEIDLTTIRPMVATPGDPDKGIPSDPKNGAYITDIGDVSIDIAYGGSCTAGKIDDLGFYAEVSKEALDAGLKVAEGVDFVIQFGSKAVEDHAREHGFIDIFNKVGVQLISPGCGACIGCGPGMSSDREQVTVSAINRNYRGRSGPGSLYLASPLTVAASAFSGKIVAYKKGMFSKVAV